MVSIFFLALSLPVNLSLYQRKLYLPPHGQICKHTLNIAYIAELAIIIIDAINKHTIPLPPSWCPTGVAKTSRSEGKVVSFSTN